MARPTPKDNARRALFGWLTDKEQSKWAPATVADLPEQVQGLIAYRQAETAELQALITGDLSVRWDLLADAAKSPLVWKAIARQMGPQALRMNLNTLLRHEVLNDAGMQAFVKNQVRLQDGDISGPKMICINIQPYGTTQAPERSDILNIGGFSDAVFNVVASFLADDTNRFVSEVEAVTLP